MKNEMKPDWIKMYIFSGQNRKEEHTHQNIELLYIIDGTVLLEVDGISYRMEKGDVIAVNSWRPHAINHCSGEKTDSLFCCIHISRKLLCEYTGQFRVFFWCNSKKSVEASSYVKLRQVLEGILLDYANSGTECNFYRCSQYYQLMHLLVSNYLVSAEELQLAGTEISEDERYHEILGFIEDNYSKELKLSEIAEKFHLSVSYLSKYLKKKLGMNFVDYLYKVRMGYTVEELLNTEHLVTRVALDHGFPNLGVFNRKFKEQYHCTPSEYRKKKRGNGSVNSEQEKGSKMIQNRLKEYFGIHRPIACKEEAGELQIPVDTRYQEPYTPVWNKAINVGDVSFLQYSVIRNALLHTHRLLKIKYIRIWNIYGEDLHIVRPDNAKRNNFAKLNQLIGFLVENHMKPILELSVKPRNIMISPDQYLHAPKKKVCFDSYADFLTCFEELIKNFISYFGREEVEEWLFELEAVDMEELCAQKIPYIQYYKDCYRIIKQQLPRVRMGGPGSSLGWYQEHMEQSVKQWADCGMYPDYLTYKYYPYAAGEQQGEQFSKRKTDESDLRNSLLSLQQILNKYHFPKRKLCISDWNMSVSSRNYFNDSLWKGCYVLKCNLEALGEADVLAYGQLSDSTTDYSDSQLLINGSGGLLTRDMIEKPAFAAMKMLADLLPQLVAKGDGYIVTANGEGEFAVILYHFINRNYLYYSVGESENNIREHYQYLEHEEDKKIELQLMYLPWDGTYAVRQYTVNREWGSIMDEWEQLAYIEKPKKEDIWYLEKQCTPRIQQEYRSSKNGRLTISCDLKPLEMRFLFIKPAEQ